MLCWSLAVTSGLKSALSPSLVDPMRLPAATSGNATDDDMRPMRLDYPLASATNPFAMMSGQPSKPEENREIPITASPLTINPTQCSAN